MATDAELIRLGNRWVIAEEAAPTRPHPGTPATPPWNRIVEPAVGVVDKLRDAVTGRRTQLSTSPAARSGDRSTPIVQLGQPVTSRAFRLSTSGHTVTI